nr:MAG TPA: hypothetical protein [Bacteriophage sp.]
MLINTLNMSILNDSITFKLNTKKYKTKGFLDW